MKVLDLFSGIGGFSLGLHRAGMETVAFCEIEKYPQLVLRKNFPGAPIYDDVRTITGAKLATDGIDTIDLVCGGFPCQDISNAGRRKGLNGAKSSLWFEMLRIIRDTKPSWVIVENSAHGKKHWLPVATEGLRELGFETVALEISAADIGANHERRRCWILAHSGSGRCALAAETIRTGWESSQLHHWWSTEPAVCRVDDGIPRRVDRLRALGNAVVPQIPEIIGRAIMQTSLADRPMAQKDL